MIRTASHKKQFNIKTTTSHILSNSLYKNWTLQATKVAFTKSLLHRIVFNFHDIVTTLVQKHAKLHTDYVDLRLWKKKSSCFNKYSEKCLQIK